MLLGKIISFQDIFIQNLCQGAGGFACKCKQSPALYVFPDVVSLIEGLRVECASQSPCLRSKDSDPPEAERLRDFFF